MDIIELHRKYQELLIENNNLKEEIKRLKAGPEDVVSDTYEDYVSPVNHGQNGTVAENPLTGTSIINKRSDSAEKVRLFMSLFRGRDDVYARRWENKKKETAGYSPVCANEWKPDICRKPKIKCLPLSTASNNWNSRFNNTFMLGENTRFQVNVMYNSPTVTLQGRREGFMFTNLALRQDFLHNKLRATIGVRDLLNTAKFEHRSEGPDFSSSRKFDLDSPIFSFSLSFRINDFNPQRQQNGSGEGMMDMNGGGEL